MTEELKILITAQVNNLKQGVQQAKSEIQSFKQQVEAARKNVDASFKAMGDSINKSVKSFGVGVAALGTALIATAASTEEYRNQQAMLEAAFLNAGSSAEVAKNTYNELYRVLGDGGQAQEAAQHLALLTTNEEELHYWTATLQGVYATFGASLPIESLTEAANETAKTGQLTGALADALNWVGISEEAFQAKLDACNTEQERSTLILDTLNAQYAEAAGAFEETNAQVLAQRDAQAALQEKLAAVGEAIAPVITSFTSLAADALALVLPYVSDLAQAAIPALQNVLKAVIPTIKSIAEWVKDNTTLLKAVAVAIGVVSAAITAYNAVAAVKAAMAAAEVVSVGALIKAYAAQAVAMGAALAPYIAIAAAIAAVIAVIVICIKHWDDIKAAAKRAWEGIKSTWQVVAKWFGDLFAKAVSSIKTAFSSITGFFKGIWENIKAIFANVGTAIATGIKGAVTNAVNSVLRTAANIINGFISAINFAIGIINAIPGVNIGRISPISVPQFAKGGIVNSATLAVVGEAGKEAVVPLENNLEWLDKLAGMLNDRMGGNQPIVLNVDGKRFAEISVDSINSLTRQRGSIPLVIS